MYSQNQQKEQTAAKIVGVMVLHQSVIASGQQFQFVICFTKISRFLSIGENKQKVVGMMLTLKLGWLDGWDGLQAGMMLRALFMCNYFTFQEVSTPTA